MLLHVPKSRHAWGGKGRSFRTSGARAVSGGNSPLKSQGRCKNSKTPRYLKNLKAKSSPKVGRNNGEKKTTWDQIRSKHISPQFVKRRVWDGIGSFKAKKGTTEGLGSVLRKGNARSKQPAPGHAEAYTSQHEEKAERILI